MDGKHEIADCVRVLAISSYSQDRLALSRILGHTAWTVEHASSLAEASEILRSTAAPVLICSQNLPDGDWKDVLTLAERMDVRSELIVVAEHADERLWAEVLNLGAYDVLTKPFRDSQVFHVVGLAWRHWRDKQKAPICAGASAVESAEELTSHA